MKKKGFTLAELIGVVVLLGAILLIIIPAVSRNLKEGKQKLYNDQIEGIKQSLQLWANDNKPGNNETYYLTLSQLKQQGLVEHDIKNPNTKEYLANDMVLKVVNKNDIIDYEVLDETGTCKSDYIDIPKMENNNNIIYVEINSFYNDTLVTAKDIDGNILNNVTSEGNVDITKLGSYYITYNITKDNKCNSTIRNVIVTDTVGPVISFKNDLEISLSQINTFDLLSDVTVTDNSGIEPTVEVTNNFASIKGNYTVKYVATDSSGNVTTKLRKVTVK